MEIREILEVGREKLKDLDGADPLKESVYILSKVLGENKIYIFTNLSKWVSKEEEEVFLGFIEDRKTGKPMSYIFNEKEFMGINFYVDERVLIPRPETEELVEFIIGFIKENYKDENIQVLDIGTGSGAIALVLGKTFKGIEVLGVDVSKEALEVARENLNRLEASNVSFKRSDLFENIGRGEKFSIIVSNPPYIRKDVVRNLQKDVKDFEPGLALDGGEDGLDFYRRIINRSKSYLEKEGMLLFEIGYDQGSEVKALMEEEGYKNVQIAKDLQGLDRIVSGLKG